MSSEDRDILSKVARLWQKLTPTRRRPRHVSSHTAVGANTRAQEGQSPALELQQQRPISQTEPETTPRKSDRHQRDSRQLAIPSNKPFAGPQTSLDAGDHQGFIPNSGLRPSTQQTFELNGTAAGPGNTSVSIDKGAVKNLGKNSSPSDTEDVNSSGPKSQPIHNPNADATRSGISGKGNETTAPALMTSSPSQANSQLLRPPRQPHLNDGANGGNIGSFSPSVPGNFTSVSVKGGTVPLRTDLNADDVLGNGEQASASRGHVTRQPPLFEAPSPIQNPGTRDNASDSEPKPDETSDTIPSSLMDNLQPSAAPNLSTQQSPGGRTSQAGDGSSGNRFKIMPMNLFRRRLNEEKSAKSSLEDFSIARKTIDGRVSLISNKYQEERHGEGSSWLTAVVDNVIVIKCEHEGFRKKLAKEVETQGFFRQFGRIDVKYDPNAKPTWVAESSIFFTPWQSKPNPLGGTIGGVILVDGKPFGLTASHGIYCSEHLKSREPESQDRGAQRVPESEDTAEPISTTSKPMMGNREVFTSWDRHSGEVVAYRFSRTLVSNTSFAQNAGTLGLDKAADWALVKLDQEEIPLNMILDVWLSSNSDHEETTGKSSHTGNPWQMYQDAIEKILWRDSYSESPRIETVSTDKTPETILIEKVLTEGEFTEKLSDQDLERVPCVVVTPSSVINGFLGWGYSTFSMYDASFSVLRVDLQSQLVDGDSGSWVFVKGRLFGMIIARSGGIDSPAGYLIPMEEIFRSISLSLSAEVRLPTQQDYRVMLLRSRQEQRRWLGHSNTEEERKWTSRLLQLELLLAQIQAEERHGSARGILDVHKSDSNMFDLSYLSMKSDLGSQPHLYRRQVVSKSTISSVLLLEDIFPIRPNPRAKFISNLQEYRKRSHPQVYQQSLRRGDSAVDELLLTPGGQNILIMVIFLWVNLQDLYHDSFNNSRKDERCRSVAEIFSAIFAARDIPAHRIPSTGELEVLVHNVITVYRFRKLPRIMAGSHMTALLSQVASHEWTRGRVDYHDATQISQLLIKLSLIARGSSEVLVCGNVLRSLPIYTIHMLELGTEVRDWCSDETWKVSRHAFSQDSSYVVIYRNLPKKLRLHGSELVAKSEIHPDQKVE